MEQDEAMEIDDDSDSGTTDYSGIFDFSGSDFEDSSLTYTDSDVDDLSDYSDLSMSDRDEDSVDSPDDDEEEEEEEAVADPPANEEARNNVVEEFTSASEASAQDGSDTDEAPSPEVVALPQGTVSAAVATESVCIDGLPTKDVNKSPTEDKSVEKSVCLQSPAAEDEGQTCPICFEPWTTSGIHRLVSLKCGHLFGQSCIEKWLKGQHAKCPQCNAMAKKADIRKLYVKNLKALDTTERDEAMKQLEKENERRRVAELEAANMRLKYQMTVQEVEKLKKDLMEHQALLQKLRSSKKKNGSLPDNPTTSQNSCFVLEKTLEMSKDGGCRILGISSFFPVLISTQSSSNKLFPGYGIRKVSTLDMKAAEYVSIHQKPIRDLAFHPYDSLVLTTALDKTIKLTNIYTNSTVQTYGTLPMEAWSCCWNKDDPCCFYAGLKNGTILQFDTRMTGSHVLQLPPTGYLSPVVALQYIQRRPSAQLEVSGPVTAQLSSCCFYETKSNKSYKQHPLPLEGNFTSLCLEQTTGHMLVSCRPSLKHSKVTHMLCEMSCSNASDDPSVIDSTCEFNVVQTLHGGVTQVKLAKSRAFLNPGNECSLLVCAGDDNSQAALLWDVNSGECLQKMKAESSVLDICNFRVNQDHFLATLTERTLRIYKWSRN